MFWQVGGVCTLNEAPFFLCEELTARGVPALRGREGRSKEEEDKAMRLRVCAAEAGSLDPARTAVNVCLGRFGQ